MAESRKLRCWNCGATLDDVPRPIGRHEHCKVCFEALRCCRLCRHFRLDINPQCDEDRADPPVNKENANFCDWFRPTTGVFQSSRTQKSDAAKDQLSGLFGEDRDEAGGEESTEEAATSGACDDTIESQLSQPVELSKEDAAKAKLDSLFTDPEKD